MTTSLDTIRWMGWPDAPVARPPRDYRLALTFANAPGPEARARIERAFAAALAGLDPAWEWTVRLAEIRVPSRGRDVVPILREAVRAADRELGVHEATIRIPEPKPVRDPEVTPAITTVERKRSEIPDAPAPWYGPHAPPGWMELGAAPLHQLRMRSGAWLVLEHVPGGSLLACYPREGDPRRVEAHLGPAERKRFFVVAADEARVLVPLRKALVELTLPDLRVMARIAVPRTPRDNNEWTDAAYLPDDRFLVSTESGLHILDRAGAQRAFARCLDALELAVTRDRRLALVSRSDGPYRGELFGLRGDELRSLGRLRKLGDPFACGDRLFAWTSPKKAIEVLGGDVAWERAFGKSA